MSLGGGGGVEFAAAMTQREIKVMHSTKHDIPPLPVGALASGRAECYKNTRRNSYITKGMGPILPSA